MILVRVYKSGNEVGVVYFDEELHFEPPELKEMLNKPTAFADPESDPAEFVRTLCKEYRNEYFKISKPLLDYEDVSSDDAIAQLEALDDGEDT